MYIGYLKNVPGSWVIGFTYRTNAVKVLLSVCVCVWGDCEGGGVVSRGGVAG